MKTQSGKPVGRAFLQIAMVMAISAAYCFGQAINVPKYANENHESSTVEDWSHRHLIYSNPGTEEDAIAKGPKSHAHWLSVTSNPRYALQQIKRPSTGDGGSFNSDQFFNPRGLGRPKPLEPAKSSISRDWSLSLGTGFVAVGMSPAKYGFDAGSGTLTGATGTPPTGNCLTDFVVFGLDIAGSSSKANLVGVDDLYSGTSPTGLCGTTPNVKWAYNVSTISGAVTTSPTLSYDGTMVAFIESSGSATSLHVLRWKDSDGTVAAPATDLDKTATSAFNCTAPCMTSTTLGAAGTTYSSPFYDFGTDTIYVGNDNGQLFEVSGVFGGTPSVVGPITVATGVKLSAPVFDAGGSGNVFVGGSNGKLYSISSSNVVSSIPVGDGSTTGGLIDGPLVDGTNETVTVFTASNAASVGGTSLSASADAVAVQVDTSLGNPQVAILGEGSSSISMYDGTFDNGYYTYSSGANTGYLYAIGTASAATTSTIYQVPYSGVASVTVSTNGAGYTTPSVSITGGMVAATATATGGVDNITITNGGTGYTSAPTVGFSGSGSGAGATAVLSHGVGTVSITNAGSGYTSTPTVNFTGGGGSGAVGTAVRTGTVSTVTVSNEGSGYTSAPTVTFTPNDGTSTATANLTTGVSSVTITNAGSAYTSTPTVSFTGGGGTGAAGTAVRTGTVSTIAVTNEGSGYTTAPTVTFTPNDGTSTATANLTTGVSSVSITSAGSGYTSAPTVGFTGGGGTGAAGTAVLTGGVTSVTRGSRGTGYTGTCSVSFSGGGGTGAAATCTFSGGQLQSTITVTSPGSGYTSAPTVTISTSGAGSGGIATAAEAANFVGSVTITNHGSGYTSAPTVGFSGGSGTGAAGTASTSNTYVGSITVNTGGAGYSSAPAVGFSGGGGTGAAATATITTTVIGSVTITNPGSGYTSAPTVGFTGGGGTAAAGTAVTSNTFIGSVTVTAGGSGYSSAPTVGFTGGGGSGATATAAITTTVIGSVTITSPGTGYTSAPTVGFSGGSGTGAAGTATLTGVVGSFSGISAGLGYSSAPTVTLTGGGGTGATATSTIDILSVAVGFGGGGYSTATVAISGGTTNATATATVNAGSVMTPGTSSVTRSLTFPAGTSPVTEILNGSTDRMFYGIGATSGFTFGDIESVDITGGGAIPTPAFSTEPTSQYGTSGIVVDNVSTTNQASSIYFGTQATSGSTCGTGNYCAIKLTQAGI